MCGGGQEGVPTRDLRTSSATTAVRRSLYFNLKRYDTRAPPPDVCACAYFYTRLSARSLGKSESKWRVWCGSVRVRVRKTRVRAADTSFRFSATTFTTDRARVAARAREATRRAAANGLIGYTFLPSDACTRGYRRWPATTTTTTCVVVSQHLTSDIV